ncbi:AGC/RSK/RSKP90 protein kinase [Phytophthora megakarya]|uniref:AGC/RSK/RSKP90 protein kinase n=1 Tax=Phytophthora megakarya TaxID=4795 RepID=A0A225X300_9STRA|nr:AGC/RSK/RSKP90 protein kinase [Phytophthora megakarya]
MSADQTPQNYQQYAEDDILVTSPTSYALRESIRRSSSSASAEMNPPPLRSTQSADQNRLPRTSSRGSIFARAPPPPPPQYPPQIPATGGSTYGMPRPVSNPNLDAMHEQNLEGSGHLGHSLGPNSTPYGANQQFANTAAPYVGGNSFNPAASTAYGGGTDFSQTAPVNNATGNRRSASRRSIFSRETFMLNRGEKESRMTIPEGTPTEIKCEGYLTKRGHLFTNWKTRYFTLRGNVLEYYSSEEKGKKYGAVTVEKVAPWSGEAHGFMFYTTKQIPYYVYASSESERSRWLRALKDFMVDSEEVSCEGYLTKRGHLVPSQRMAYYVLNGTSLRHYTDQQAYRDNESAMAEVEIRSVAPWDGEANGLMFMTVTGNVFYVIADTVGEQQKWLATVKRSTASVPEPVSCAGYLTKQGHKRKSWKKRYFILRGNAISYYSDYDMANNTKGKPLAEVLVEDVQKWDGEPFGFMFMTSEQVPYYVYADNDRERTKWMNALHKLNAVEEEPEVEKKRCPNCNAVLTGSRFCGACGFNLRGTTIGERSSRAQTINDEGEDDIDGRDDIDDETTPFDELEALSEGARTLLLAVMQTPDGVDVGEGTYPNRMTRGSSQQPLEQPDPNNNSARFDQDITDALSEVHADEKPTPATDESDEDDAKSPSYGSKPTPRSPVRQPSEHDSSNDAESPVPSPQMPSPVVAPPTPPKAKKDTLKPNFGIVAPEPKKHSFTSFSDSEEEESKAEPKPAPVPVRTSSRSSAGLLMAGMGRRKTTAMLAMESSSDDESGDDTELPTKPPSDAYKKPKGSDDSDEEEDKPTGDEAEDRGRKSSADSLELDTRGISAFDDPVELPKLKHATNTSIRMSERTDKKDIYNFMEKELNFTPQFVPSADSPVRCRFYSSMAYTTAKKVILFLSDSGPLGLWKQDPENAKLTIDHKWSMTPYFSRAQEEGYGIVVCNPFSNMAVVYEAGGFEREVPVPNSSTPTEHVLYVWDQFITKCKGQVSIIAYARGGALVKSILETYEQSARDKIYRVALIESKHEIDHNESPGILELLGRRSINWEASYEPLGAQIVDSQARVNCVCLSLGFMPSQEADNTPKTLEKAEDPSFAFIGANPSQPGMTAVVKHVRAELRRRKTASKPIGRPRRQSNIIVIGETDADESSDVSGGADEGKNGNKANGNGNSDDDDGNKIKATYYLPKPVPKPKRNSGSSSGGSSGDKQRLISDKDFELMKVVGQGGFGKVFLCRKVTPPHLGDCYAMKVLKKQQVVSSGLVNTTMAERKILTDISHPFVVKLHYAFQSESKLYLVMDYLSGGSLATHLRRRRKFPEEWARFYAAEVGVSGLKGATTFCGTAAYIAPELLKGKVYGKAADWWSFGILLYEMIGGKPPYYHRNRDIMFQTILKQDWVTFSPSFSDAAISLINGLLTRDPMMRLGSGPRGADEVLTHPFFDSIDWPELLERKMQPPFNPGVGKMDTHYAPRNMNEITARDREPSVMMAKTDRPNDFDGFSFVGRPSSLSNV